MSGLTRTIQVSSGVYTIKVPSGKLGAKHFSILMKYMPAQRTVEEPLPNEVPQISPADQARFADAFVEWAPAILPEIIVDGPFKYEDMPGTDQFGIFTALCQEIGDADKLFQIIK